MTRTNRERITFFIIICFYCFPISNLNLSSCSLSLSLAFTELAGWLLMFSFCDLWFECHSLRLAVFHSCIEFFVSCLVPCALRFARYTLHVARCVLSFIRCALWVMYYVLLTTSWGFHVMPSCFYHEVWGMIVLC